ncbi:S26 family signal peptidase [Sphingobium yanoikuyae]|jgi:conjugal transfer pilin signal peptidase TrbI|uniref:S26 family signal peptidase n=1 Tax=Sphingobium yanoikuyae TaxID=13690 RepID=A0A9X7YAN7_SPHYA|nr:S26 family signal peptidase [Sphingobium yanoikuyae]QNG43600.1 S26 family signal peptidase [Sphingobium yanoikuyae]
MLLLTWRAGNRLWRELKDLPLRAAVALGASGLGQPARPAQLLKAYGIVLPIGLFAWWAMPQITLVMTPSIDAWVVHRSPGPIHRGDLIFFTLSDHVAGPKPVAITKYALCLPGDRISMVERHGIGGLIANGWYYCNGRLMGVSKPAARNGKALMHWRPESPRIPKGMIFVGSRHPDGYDSRYYGPVAIERLTRMEKLL